MGKDEVDPLSEDRKLDHIKLAIDSQTDFNTKDKRFFYEPIFSGLNTENIDLKINFSGMELNGPFWISSMTGGTNLAKELNSRFAIACGKYGIGMGLGSCRCLLDSEKIENHPRYNEFNIKDHMVGYPLYANIGVSQVEELLKENKITRLNDLVYALKADGLIIHINPLQEWYQPEGDRYNSSPLELIKEVLSVIEFPLIVKEVGQGFGPESLLELMKLPLAAIDFGAYGGTNFSKLEYLRSDEKSDFDQEFDSAGFIYVGHTANEMVEFIIDILGNSSVEDLDKIKCKNFIISGGVKDYLQGHFLQGKLGTVGASSIIAQASGFLKYALLGQEQLDKYIEHNLQGLKLAKMLLRVNPHHSEKGIT